MGKSEEHRTISLQLNLNTDGHTALSAIRTEVGEERNSTCLAHAYWGSTSTMKSGSTPALRHARKAVSTQINTARFLSSARWGRIVSRLGPAARTTKGTVLGAIPK